MTTLYLIRHGEVINPLRITYSSIRDVPLSDLGKTQIEHLCQQMKSRQDTLENIFASPFLRTQQTAEICKVHFPHASLEISDSLKETRTNNFVGRRLSWFKSVPNPYLPEVQQQFDYSIEPLEEQGKRIASVISEAAKKYPDSCIAIIGHGHPLSSGYYAFSHPEKLQFTVSDLRNTWYAKRGSFLRLTLNESFQILSHEVFE